MIPILSGLALGIITGIYFFYFFNIKADIPLKIKTDEKTALLFYLKCIVIIFPLFGVLFFSSDQSARIYAKTFSLVLMAFAVISLIDTFLLKRIARRLFLKKTGSFRHSDSDKSE